MNLVELAASLRRSRGFAHKADIGEVLAGLGPAPAQAPALGDDCAALPDGDGYLLFAIEGLVEDFVQAMPWFAGYSAVVVNVSDIYAMGGRPLAVVDALWSDGAATAGEVLAGMSAACAKYGMPLVGGHSNSRASRPNLAVAILGRARRLLTSFDARAGDALMMAIDLRGAFQEPYPFWNASTDAPGDRLRGDLEILPALTEAGLCAAAKDISMAGAVGTALMLAECSGVGAAIDVDAIPRPPGVALERWLTAFPSYGFVLSLRPEAVVEVGARFAARDIAWAVVGEVDDSRRLVLRRGAEEALLWDFGEESFICPRRMREAAHV
jgi:uncharacterized protein